MRIEWIEGNGAVHLQIAASGYRYQEMSLMVDWHASGGTGRLQEQDSNAD
jgi:hypothetical protein